MFLHIDPGSGLAIYDQIVRQVKFAVAGGGLPPGQLIPSVRELARELAVNPNTVARAFQQLQADGVVESVRGQGLAVSRGADKRCRTARLQMISDRLREVLDEALRAGLEVDEIRKLVDDQVEALDQRRARVLNVPSLEARRETSSKE